jgi:glycosyltransferase involved in cell wall biosynthesis
MTTASSAPDVRGRTLLISENAPVPADRRVWNECRTLTEAGWQVVVACAAEDGGSQRPREVLDGIEVHRYPLRPSGGGVPGYVREYGQAAWRLRRLVRRLARERHFDVVHAANPPDFLLATAAELRRRGTRLIFDHHDLVPELFRSRFGDRPGYRVALAGERLAFSLADVIICTNDSYRQVAIERGGQDPADVFVVRNGPDLERFTPVAPDAGLRRGRPHLLAYLGLMGPQDGIDDALRALAWLRERRSDWHAAFVGNGEVLEDMKALAEQLGLANSVEFFGWRGEPAERRVDDDEDPRISRHGAAGRLVEPARVADLRRRGRDLCGSQHAGELRTLHRRAARRSRAPRADGSCGSGTGALPARVADLGADPAQRIRARDRAPAAAPQAGALGTCSSPLEMTLANAGAS